MAKIQSLSPDPNYSEDESPIGRKAMDVVKGATLAGIAIPPYLAVAKHERDKSARKKSDKDALENQKEYGMKKGGKVKAKRYDEGGVLEGIKDTYLEGVNKVGDDFHRIAGTEKGKQLDKEAQKEMYKRASNAGMRAAAQDLKNERVRAEAGRYKQGGKVKSASARADGCAIRGKTRA